jgi:hypothetical protein
MAAEVEAAKKEFQVTADAAVAAARTQLEQVTLELRQARMDGQTVVATIDEVRADAKALRTALDESHRERRALDGTLEKTRAHHKALQSTIDKMRADETKRQEKIAALEVLIQKERERCALVQAELETMKAAKAKADAQYKTAKEAWLKETSTIREAGSRIASEELESLREAFQRLDATATVTEGLNVLVSSLGAAFPRVALFHVNGNRLEGRQQAGFDFENNISKVIVPLTKGSAFDAAVQSGRTQRLAAADLLDANKTLFGGAPSIVLILPVVIAGTTAAVLYADDSGQPASQLADPQRVVTSAELLILHAMPLLARLSAQEKLAEYERQLLNDFQIV